MFRKRIRPCIEPDRPHGPSTGPQSPANSQTASRPFRTPACSGRKDRSEGNAPCGGVVCARNAVVARYVPPAFPIQQPAAAKPNMPRTCGTPLTKGASVVFSPPDRLFAPHAGWQCQPSPSLRPYGTKGRPIPPFALQATARCACPVHRRPAHTGSAGQVSAWGYRCIPRLSVEMTKERTYAGSDNI